MTGKKLIATSARWKGALPRSVDLGFWIIHIKYVGDKRMREEAECEYDEDTPEGLWNSDLDTIFILRSLSLGRKRYTICHELIHAMVDSRDALARTKDLPK